MLCRAGGALWGCYACGCIVTAIMPLNRLGFGLDAGYGCLRRLPIDLTPGISEHGDQRYINEQVQHSVSRSGNSRE